MGLPASEAECFLRSEELHFKLGLYSEQFINFAYGTFKIASGVILGSAWIGCDGIYNMAQAIFAIFSLQASMSHAFGTGERWEHLLNIITGSTVCLLIVSTGIYMIRRANREIKQLQESNNGD